MKTILAIGGAVIKTAYDESKECARRKKFDVMTHKEFLAKWLRGEDL